MDGHNGENRIGAFDRIRLIAICAVILLHTVSGVSDTMPAEMTDLQYRAYRCIEALCAFGVPCFLMLSGALLLAPEKEISLKTLFLKYIRRIVLAILLFATAFAWAELVFAEGRDFVSAVPEAFLRMLTGRSWAHMWYLYTLLVLYLLLPLLKRYTASALLPLQIAVLVLLFVLFSALPFLQGRGVLHLPLQLPGQMIFLFYFLAGHVLNSVLRTGERTGYLPGAVLAASFALILYIFYMDTGWSMSYDAPVIVLYALSLFALLVRFGKTLRPAAFLAPYVFGMYLTHTVFLNACYKGLHLTPLAAGGFLLLPVFFAAAFVCAFALSWLLRKIPPLRKYVL